MPTNTYLVVRYIAHTLDVSQAQVVTAENEDQAAAQMYGNCVVIPCSVFDSQSETGGFDTRARPA